MVGIRMKKFIIQVMGVNNGLIETPDLVLFWGGPLSNFYEAPYQVVLGDGRTVTMNCTEKHFMYIKAMTFGDKVMAEKILLAPTPGKAKALGRKVQGYDDNVWSEVRYNVMLEVNLLKYRNNAEVRDILLKKNWRNKHFVEASPYDKIWGIGLNMDDPKSHDPNQWEGQNLLGKCLDEVREILLEEEAYR